LTIPQVIDRVKEFNPLVIGYNLITENFLDSLVWIEAIKEATGIKTVVGGLHMELYPRETLAHEAIDIGVTGEGWHTFPELLNCLEGRGDLSRVRGICYREDGNYRVTPARPNDLTLEDVPFPARHLLPNECYTTVMSRAWPITVMVSALGCPFNCAYCDIPSDRYQSRHASHVVDEMEECVRRFGIREIWFQDESFTINRQRVLDICSEIRRRNIKVDWSIRTRPDLVDRETIKAMKEAGLVKIHFGIESGEPEILKMLNRPIPIEVMKDAVRLAREEGLTTLGFFMVGLPGETEDSIRKTIRLALELNCDYIQVNKFTPCPPSTLYKETVKETGVDYWRQYTLGDADVISALPGLGSGLDPLTLDRWQRRFFRAYYYRPSYVWNRLKKVGSLKELYNLASSALSIR